MTDPDSPETGFKVVDRRGKGTEPEEKSASPSPRQGPGTSAESAAGAAAPEAARAELAALFLMLASSVLIHLGEVADPVTQEVRKELGQARYTIDLLMVLKEKTEGHRTPQETQLLEEILHDLQVRFVRAVNQR